MTIAEDVSCVSSVVVVCWIEFGGGVAQEEARNAMA